MTSNAFPSNNIRYANDTQVVVPISADYVKTKSIVINTGIAGIIRVWFSWFSFDSHYAKIMQNGTVQLATFYKVEPYFGIVYQDIPVTLNINDTIELWVAATGTNNYVSNFDIGYDDNPKPIDNMYWHATYQDSISLDGADNLGIHADWITVSSGNQSIYDPALVPNGPGYLIQTNAHDGDEIFWPYVYFNTGTYKVRIVYIATTDMGMAEMYHGNTLIGTVDMYFNGVNYNQEKIFTYTVSTPTTASVRMKVNGKNVNAINYFLQMSVLEIINTCIGPTISFAIT